MSRVGRGTAATFEHDDAFAGLRKQVRGRETGDPTADDDHIGFGIVGELGILRKRGRRRPVRGGVTLCAWASWLLSASRLGVRRMHRFRFR